jgi:hypothetical protein
MSYVSFTERKKLNTLEQVCTKDIVPLNQVFNLVNEIYSQKETSMLSNDEIYRNFGGMIITAKGNKQDLFYSYYVLGNKEDEEQIIKNASNDNFICFNCDLCALDKTDAVGLYNKTKVQILKNVVEEFCDDITTETGFSFRLTPNATVYLPGHLLLTTLTHIPTLSTFLNKELLYSYFMILTKFYNSGVEVNCMWNGFSGSETEHSHCHLTDYKIPIIEYVKKKNYQNNINVDNIIFPGTNTPRSYIIIKSTDLSDIYTYCSNFILNTQIFPIEKYKTLKSFVVIANLFVKEVIINKNSTFEYYVIFALVNKTSRFLTVQSGNKKEGVFCIPATSQIMISENQIDFIYKNKDTLIELVNKYTYYPCNMVTETDFTSSVNFKDNLIILYKQLTSPNLDVKSLDEELLTSVMFNYIKDDIKISSIVIDNYVKILTTYECFENMKRCNVIQFGIFKILLTYVFLYNYYYKSNINVDLLQKLSIKSSIFYFKSFIKSYNVNECLWLRGDYVSKVLAETVENVILYTPKEELSKILVTENIKIGDKSVSGYMLKAQNKYISKFDILIKIQDLSKSLNNKAMYQHELEAGKCINLIRKKCMNFMLTFGGFTCLSSMPNKLDKKYNVCDNGNELLGHLLVEYIQTSFTINSGIKEGTLSISNLYSLLTQTLSAVLFANLYYGFTHYDLHLSNILAVPINSCIKDTIYIAKYHLEDKILENICYGYYPVIIDYGKSYTNDMNKDKIYPFETTSNKVYDHWTTFVKLLYYICAYNPSILLKENLNNDLDIICSEFIEKYICIFLEYFYYYITSDYDKKFRNNNNPSVIALYDEVLEIAEDSYIQNLSLENKYSYVKEAFKLHVFKKIYVKTGNEYVWFLPTNYLSNVEEDNLLDDLETFVQETQKIFKELLITNENVNFENIDVFEISKN